MELQRRIRNDLNYTDKEWNKVVTLNHQRSKVDNVKMADKERNKLRVGVGRAKIKTKQRPSRRNYATLGVRVSKETKNNNLGVLGSL